MWTKMKLAIYIVLPLFANQKLTGDARFDCAEIAAQNDGNVMWQGGDVFPHQQHSILAREFVIIVQMNVDHLNLEPWGLLHVESVRHSSRLVSIFYSNLFLPLL